MGKEANIIETGTDSKAELSIVLGWNLIPDEIVLNQPYIIYQLEPLVLPLWQEKLTKKRELFKKALSIWDYSEVNSEYMNRLGLTAEVIPLGYHSKLEEVIPHKFSDFDVLFVG
ncbi:MAG: hypothetical protein PF495_19740, partial [Spirochaetales bacterium]|nr:hypothetical protein [Spirochaetales bacterium]